MEETTAEVAVGKFLERVPLEVLMEKSLWEMGLCRYLRISLFGEAPVEQFL